MFVKELVNINSYNEVNIKIIVIAVWAVKYNLMLQDKQDYTVFKTLTAPFFYPCYYLTIDCINRWMTCFHFLSLCKSKSKYPGCGDCHLVLVASFGARDCTVRTGQWSHGIEFLPKQLSIVTFHSLLIASENYFKHLNMLFICSRIIRTP